MQCGIQVGQKLVQLLSSDVQLDEILVDTERKTWFSIEQSDRRVVVDAGATNNWAHGYSDDIGADKTLEAVRKCFESGAISLYIAWSLMSLFKCSIAGGTGSGLGSRITEEVRDAYPKHFIWNCVISPFASGETALQHYNSLLSLSSLQMSSDMMSIFSNDVLMGSIAKQQSLYKSKGDSKISISELNQQIVLTLAGVLLPTCPIVSNGDGDLHEGLTPPVSWDDLASDLLRNMAPASTSLKRSEIKARTPSIVPPPAKDLELAASSNFGKSSKSNNRSLTSNDGIDNAGRTSVNMRRSRTCLWTVVKGVGGLGSCRYHEACRPSKVEEPVSKRGSKLGWDSSLPGDKKRASERWGGAASYGDDEEVDIFPWRIPGGRKKRFGWSRVGMSNSCLRKRFILLRA
ncbi:Tubulin/FtsZ family, GTPase domain-containing protein [Chytriomyces cf. hyalinus JEL632]|nr:Tubulin/FtsZ family, GTPase domain-containing protein [Chytriomyces cf. hyalinus JEL632]